MKAEPENEVGNGEVGNAEEATPITGDVIGDTAYSERFVLKILLKLANHDTLKEELKKPTFEEELCTLWDMTTEKDVVLYLLTNNTLDLIYFALPVIKSLRIIEVIIGTVANMCCHKEVVNSFMANKELPPLLLHFMKCDRTEVLYQLLRLISACLYVADERDIRTWLDMFEAAEYPQHIYFILKNASNKLVLITALENLNTICTNCKLEGSPKFSALFEIHDAIPALYSAHREYSGQVDPDEKLERLHLITLQMMLHLNKHEIINTEQPNPEEDSMTAINLLREILSSYENKISDDSMFDEDLLDVLDAATFFVQYLVDSGSPDKYFNPSYKMWKAVLTNEKQKNCEKKQIVEDIKEALGLTMCIYLAECSNEHLLKVLDDIGDDYGCIVSQINDPELQAKIANKALNYRMIQNETE